jgi:hypothetical protein
MPQNDDDFTAGTYSKLAEVEEKKKRAATSKPVKYNDTTVPSNHDTTTPTYNDELVESIRKAVKQLGKEAATYRFTMGEKKALADILYNYKTQGVRASENEITRIAINFLIEDYRQNSKGSVLAKVIERLNA